MGALACAHKSKTYTATGGSLWPQQTDKVTLPGRHSPHELSYEELIVMATTTQQAC